MYRERRRRKKDVTILSDARVKRISIVRHAANETPIAVVKSAKVCHTEKDGEVIGDKGKMAKKSSKKGARAGVHQIDFDKKAFKSAEAVKEFLESKDYAGFKVQEDETKFYVVGKSAKSYKGELDQVIHPDNDNVTVHLKRNKDAEVAEKNAEESNEAPKQEAEAAPEEVATEGAEEQPKEEGEAKPEGGEEPKAEAEGEEPAKEDATNDAGEAKEPAIEEAEKALVKKFDSWAAHWSEEKDLDSVIEAGEDGMPIGAESLTGVMYTTVSNNLKEGDTAGAQTAIKDYGDKLIALYNAVHKSALKDAQKSAVIEKLFGNSKESEGVAKSAEEAVSKSQLTSTVTELQEKLLSALTQVEEKLDSSVKGIEEANKSASEKLESLQKEISSQNERLESVETINQVRKSQREFVQELNDEEAEVSKSAVPDYDLTNFFGV